MLKRSVVRAANPIGEDQMDIDENGTHTNPMSDSEVLTRLIDALEQAAPESRKRLLATLAIYFEIHEPLGNAIVSERRGTVAQSASTATADHGTQSGSFSEDRAPSPKEFMLEKNAKTDVERVACLAYYLTHYRDSDGFKTLDISKLNAEAAQLKLGNAAQAVDNAAKAGFLISYIRGQKRISALGELYVQALPDRAAARESMAHAKPKRKKKTRNNGVH